MNLLNKIRLLLSAQEEKKRPIDLSRTLNDAVEQTESLADSRDMKINQRCNLECCEVLGGSLLKEVFSNVIENAVYHSEGRKIKISCDWGEDEVTCSIEDDGSGIPEEEKEKIFEKGYTTDEERGTGLGMFLVKMLLDIYDGDVDVKDSEMGGARFDVKLKKVDK